MAATCKSCGAPIVWIESPKHKWIPCDEGLIPYQEDRHGKDSIVTSRGEIIRCRLTFDGEPTGLGRTTHWATCPNAEPIVNKYFENKALLYSLSPSISTSSMTVYMNSSLCATKIFDLKEKKMKKNDMFKHIVAIRTAKNNSVIGGTGFFVKTEDEKIFLVTANHVARDTTTNTDIWVRNLATGLPFAFKINQLNKMVMWLYHPIADIAILEVESNEKLDLSLYVLPISFFEKSFTSIPERESIVTMYGMPDVYTDLEFAPFTCDSYPASNLWVSYFDVTGSQYKCFMLDKPSTQGFSGGPVISFAKADAPICYGIVHGTRQDNTGGKLAIVVHSAYLFELIEYQHRRKNK